MNPTPLNVASEMEILKIRYEGLPGIIDANTYINSLLHLTAVVREASKEVDPSREVQVNIIANKEGSFAVDLGLVSTIVDSAKILFTKDNLEYLASVTAVVSGAYGLAKFLRGKKPKDIETKGDVTQITNNDGTVNYFDFRGANLYLTNSVVNNAINQEMETLSEDEGISGFEIQDKNEQTIVSFDKEEMQEIAAQEPDGNLFGTEKKPTKEMLSIVSLDWDLKKKWEFIRKGVKIRAMIKDPEWRDRIDKGERFGKGDRLEVEMETVQVYDESVGVWVDKSYTITKIIGHQRKQEPPKLDLKD